ncbi:hypothetical protein L7F22_006936 [Adiantum nelumboides]|nr:hypothetical protein [Adiantum nelumboides]
MGLLVTVLFVLSLRLQVQAVDELSKEGIVCIAQNQEKTAVGRWLHCLQTYSSLNTQDDEADPYQVIELYSSDPFFEHMELGQLTDAKDIVAPDEIILGQCEENKCALRLDNENAKDAAKIETTSFNGEDVILSWLKVNLTIFAVCRLLFGLFRRYSSHEEFSDPSMMPFQEESLEGVPEISKSVIVDDSPSTSHSAAANLPMLGSSLGSAVGAVISEVILKSCSSGLPVPADNICMILESALKDLSLQVGGSLIYGIKGIMRKLTPVLFM